MVQFLYRYVGYGTRFTRGTGLRPVPPGVSSPVWVKDEGTLYENEIVVDVGSVCLGYGGCSLPVIDHHFPRFDGNFPSATAGVLHSASTIRSTFEKRIESDTEQFIWLVTHKTPDFDACAALFIVRSILDPALSPESRCPFDADSWAERGIAPGGWTGDRPIDWYGFDAGREADDAYRWPILLASVASHVDQGRPMTCLRHRALHSILYAAQKRGRPIMADAGWSFFDAVRQRMLPPRRLNPLFDSVFEDEPEYSPELALLDLESERYARDVRRSRRCIVTVRNEDFESWFSSEAKDTPFLREENGRLEVDPRHLRTGVPATAQVDGIYLRDPESILFKEWARDDRENSSLGAGFLFTAVARSNERPDAFNRTGYIFALDPERAGNRHIYNVWARLQAMEMMSEGRLVAAPPPARADFIGREVGADPWYDGNAYRATIIDTPRSGSRLESGTASDLTDDPVARIVQEELEDQVFETPVCWKDLETSNPTPDPEPLTVSQLGDPSLFTATPVTELEGLSLQAGTFRMAAVRLSEGSDLLQASFSLQIAKRLWAVLEPAGVSSVPADFATRHVVRRPDHLIAWSRHGMVIGFLASAEKRVNQLFASLQEYAWLISAMHRLVEDVGAEVSLGVENLDERRRTGHQLLRLVTKLKLAVAAPDGVALRRLFEDTRFEEVAEMLNHINDQMFADQERRRDEDLQIILGVGASIAILVSLCQITPPAPGFFWEHRGWFLLLGFLLFIAPAALVLWQLKLRGRKRSKSSELVEASQKMAAVGPARTSPSKRTHALTESCLTPPSLPAGASRSARSERQESNPR